jgi:DNA-binding transcriptional ArsR family regulator
MLHSQGASSWVVMQVFDNPHCPCSGGRFRFRGSSQPTGPTDAARVGYGSPHRTPAALTDEGRQGATPTRTPDLPPDHVIAQALSHPLRARALAILAERTATPKELGVALTHLSYHIRTLAERGVIRLDHRTPPSRGDRPSLPRHGPGARRRGAALGLTAVLRPCGPVYRLPRPPCPYHHPDHHAHHERAGDGRNESERPALRSMTTQTTRPA